MVRTQVLAPAVGVLLGLGVLAIALVPEQSPLATRSWSVPLVPTVAAWSLLAAAVAVMLRRPGNRAAVLLMVAGTSFGLGSWAGPWAAGSALIFSVGLLVGPLVPGLVTAAAVLLSSGPARRPALAVAGAGVSVGLIGVGLLPALWFDPASAQCSSCVENVLAVADSPTRHLVLGRIGLVLYAGWAVVAVAVLVGRLAHAGAARSGSLPLIITACGYLVAVVVADVQGFESNRVGIADPDDRIWFVQAIGLTAVAAAVGMREVIAHRRRRRTARLVLDLARSAGRTGVAGALAEALGDPDLRVGYPTSDGRLVDANLAPIDVPEACGAIPVVRGGVHVAVVIHRSDIGDASHALDDAVSIAGLALDRERVQVDLEFREAELRESRRRIVDAADTEREQLERDLHDGVQQRLVGALVKARLLCGPSADDPAVQAVCEAFITAVRAALDGVRQVSHRLSPPALIDGGLAAALDSLAEDYPETLVDPTALGGRRLPIEVERVTYWVVSEMCREGATSIVSGLVDTTIRLELVLPRAPACWQDLCDRVGALDGYVGARDTPERAVHIEVRVPCG